MTPRLKAKAGAIYRAFVTLASKPITPELPFARPISYGDIIVNTSRSLDVDDFVLLKDSPVAEVQILTPPPVGTATVLTGNLIQITIPTGTTPGNYSGMTYRARDLDGNWSNSAPISFTVVSATATNPVMVPMSLSIPVNSSALYDLTAFVTPGTFPIDNLVVVTNGTKATVTTAGPTQVTIAAPNNQKGADSATIRVVDTAGNTSNTVTLSLTIVNQAPVAQAFFRNVTALGSVELDIPFRASDPDGNLGTLSNTKVQIGTAPTKGSTVIASDGKITYTHTTGSGTDTLTYRVQDLCGDWSAYATVTINIGGTNQAPVCSNGTGSAVYGGSAIERDLRSFVADPDDTDDELTYSIITGPSAGTATILTDGFTLRYTPPASGTDGATVTIVWRAQDDGGLNDDGTFTITLNTASNGTELPTFPRTIRVTTRAELTQALGGNFNGLTTVPANANGPLRALDCIELADGNYGGAITLSGSNVGFWVKARNNQMAVFAGQITLGSANMTAWGLLSKVTGNTANSGLKIAANDCTFIRCKADRSNNAGGINGGAGDVLRPRFLFCEWTDQLGRAVSFVGAADWLLPANNSPNMRPLVWGCYFHDKRATSNNAEEALQFGQTQAGGNSKNPADARPYGYPTYYNMQGCCGYTRFEVYNLNLNNVNDNENETCSVKSSGNLFYDCTYIDTNLCNGRMGNDNRWEACWFAQNNYNELGGIGVYGDRNIVLGCRFGTGCRLQIFGGTQSNDLGQGPTVPGQTNIAWGPNSATTPGANPAARFTKAISNNGILRVGHMSEPGDYNAEDTRVEDHTGTIFTNSNNNWSTRDNKCQEVRSTYGATASMTPRRAARAIPANRVGVNGAWVPPPTWSGGAWVMPTYS